MADFKVHPLQASVEQGGFSRERGGNLRDHDGCRANPKALAATVHYDGDYGSDQVERRAQREKAQTAREDAALDEFRRSNPPPKSPSRARAAHISHDLSVVSSNLGGRSK